jgi:hypothetical protein
VYRPAESVEPGDRQLIDGARVTPAQTVPAQGSASDKAKIIRRDERS